MGMADPPGPVESAQFNKGMGPMELSPDSTMLTRKQLVVFAFFILTLAGAISIVFETTLSVEMVDFLWPTLTTIIIFVLFSIGLRWQVGGNLFGELGFLYLGLAVAYTVLPAFAFMVGSLNLGDPVSRLSPAPSELVIHLWRHVLFVFGVAAGYLLVRGRAMPQLVAIKDLKGKDSFTIVFLIGMIAICILFITLMSAPVHSYYDHYIRYDHLPWFSRKLVSICLRVKLGIYSVLITFLFLNYKKYRLMIFTIVTIICLHEMIYSFGSRIETFIILLETICLYNYTVKSITLKKGLVACVALAILFTAVELFRLLEFNLSSPQDLVLQLGLEPASEFYSVYLTGFHLYAERLQGVLPPTEWPMFFNDFISMVTFGDFTRWHPMDWYVRNYYPDSVVAPFTLGPIADSAIWGGEVDLLLRSLINGAFFAYVVRWFLRHKDRWWGVTIYVYCYATCVMTLKYSIFYQFTPLLKTLLPTLLVIMVVRTLIPSKQKPARDGLNNLRRNAEAGG